MAMNIAEVKMKIEVRNFLDPDFLALAEKEFIFCKQRTGNMLEHFPFLKEINKYKNIVIKNERDGIVGGLIVKISQDKQYLVGSIGLVVIAKEERGRGYSSLLFNKTIEICKSEKLDYLLLWTSLHDFYTQFGFELDDPLAYLEVSEQLELTGIQMLNMTQFEAQPTYTQNKGVLTYSASSVSYLHDGSGYIFIDYAGDVAEAASIMTHKFGSQRRPRVYIPKKDPLINELFKRQPNLIQYDHNYEMWFKLTTNVFSRKVYKFLHRI